MSAKYELTDERHPDFPALRRIRALCDVRPGVRAGDLGGWVESEHNLDHEGACWVYGSAHVYGSARVSDSARVYGSARAWSPETCLSVTGLPSGLVTLTPSADRTVLLLAGCWHGTPDDLRTLIAGDDWPEARGDEQDRRRPGLTALADLADAVAATWGDPAEWPIEDEGVDQ